MTVSIARTTIIGTGLIGGSLAAAGRKAGALRRVVGVGRGRPNLETALAAGLVDEIEQDPVAAVGQADLVVLAAPVNACVEILERIAGALPPDAIVTDVGSVKAPLCRRAEQLGLAERFVGGHPMAGGVGTGAALADAELFRERVVVITPTRATRREAIDLVEGLWAAVGARIVEMDAERHDFLVAASSHLPQMVVYALAAALCDDPDAEEIAELSGSGMRDTTRLALSDADMWAAIAALNRPALVARMEQFQRTWQLLQDAVAAGDEQRLRSLIRAAQHFKRRLSK